MILKQWLTSNSSPCADFGATDITWQPPKMLCNKILFQLTNVELLSSVFIFYVSAFSTLSNALWTYQLTASNYRQFPLPLATSSENIIYGRPSAYLSQTTLLSSFHGTGACLLRWQFSPKDKSSAFLLCFYYCVILRETGSMNKAQACSGVPDPLRGLTSVGVIKCSSLMMMTVIRWAVVKVL